MQLGSLQNITQIRPSLVPKRICGPFYNIMSWASSVHIFLTRHSLTFAYGTTMLSKFSYSPHTNSLQATRSGLLYIALPLTSQYWFSLLVTELVAMKKKKYLQVQCGTGGFIWAPSLKAKSVLVKKSRQQKHNVAGHTASRVRNQRARNADVHPFSCSSFSSVWDPTQWSDPTQIHQECFSSDRLLWKHCQRHVQRCVS